MLDGVVVGGLTLPRLDVAADSVQAAVGLQGCLAEFAAWLMAFARPSSTSWAWVGAIRHRVASFQPDARRAGAGDHRDRSRRLDGLPGRGQWAAHRL